MTASTSLRAAGRRTLQAPFGSPASGTTVARTATLSFNRNQALESSASHSPASHRRGRRSIVALGSSTQAPSLYSGVRQLHSSALRRQATPIDDAPVQQGKKKEKLVILGSGWGGMTLLKSIDKKKYDVHIVSPNTYFAMTPLLCQAAVGSLDFRSVMEPVRSSPDVQFHHAWVDELDIPNNTLKLMPSYPPAFREIDPLLPASEQQKDARGQARTPSAIPPQSDQLRQDKAKVQKEVNQEGTLARVPVSRGGYATTFKKPVHRRDVEGIVEHPGQPAAANASKSPLGIVPPHHSEEGRHYELKFDKLVIAVGAYNRTFGIKGVKDHAWFLKDAQNARSIRWRILETLEQASHPELPEEEKRKLLSWVVVGGGPTDDELIGEINEFVSSDLKRILPALAPLIQLTLVDSAAAILGNFDQRLSEYAREKFLNDEIDVRLKRTITGVEPGVLHIKEDGPLPFGLLVWSTGITSSPLIRSIKGIKKERRTVNLLTDDQFRALKSAPGEELVDLRPLPAPAPPADKLKSRKTKQTGVSYSSAGPSAITPQDEVYDHIYAIGDCAIIQGRMMPATAQVAAAKAKHLALVLNGSMEGDEEKYFRHASKGAMTNLGSSQAIAELPTAKLSGRGAWLIWRGAYTWMSLSWRNRIMVPFGWTMNWLFGRDLSRF